MEQLTDPLVTVNDEVIAYVPGSFRYREGLGGRSILPQSEGNGRTSQVMATDQSTAIGFCAFALYATPDNIKRQREWQQRRNRNVVTFAAKDQSGSKVTRAFTQAVVMNDPEIPFSADGSIAIEWGANTAT